MLPKYLAFRIPPCVLIVNTKIQAHRVVHVLRTFLYDFDSIPTNLLKQCGTELLTINTSIVNIFWHLVCSLMNLHLPE